MSGLKRGEAVRLRSAPPLLYVRQDKLVHPSYLKGGSHVN